MAPIHRVCRRAAPPAVALIAAAALLAGCKILEDPNVVPYVEAPVDQLYNSAMADLEAGRYEQAAEQFDEVERQHPYSVWATKAQLMAAFSYYRKSKYDEAIIALDRFIQLHPGNRDIAYAYYLKALSYYEQISDVGRDQQMTEYALSALQDVANRFADSKYARDARLKIDLTLDHLAGKEMEIGRYYLGQDHYLAALNRFRVVVEQYQTTTHIPEALHRLTECYLALGLHEEAKASAAVLGYNFPSSDWYLDSYALLGEADLRPERDEQSWVDKIFGS